MDVTITQALPPQGKQTNYARVYHWFILRPKKPRTADITISMIDLENVTAGTNLQTTNHYLPRSMMQRNQGTSDQTITDAPIDGRTLKTEIETGNATNNKFSWYYDNVDKTDPDVDIENYPQGLVPGYDYVWPDSDLTSSTYARFATPVTESNGDISTHPRYRPPIINSDEWKVEAHGTTFTKKGAYHDTAAATDAEQDRTSSVIKLKWRGNMNLGYTQDHPSEIFTKAAGQPVGANSTEYPVFADPDNTQSLGGMGSSKMHPQNRLFLVCFPAALTRTVTSVDGAVRSDLTGFNASYPNTNISIRTNMKCKAT